MRDAGSAGSIIAGRRPATAAAGGGSILAATATISVAQAAIVAV
ncbi:hypothetical protein ACLQ26_28590 [Micromonospora sp. DT43]